MKNKTRNILMWSVYAIIWLALSMCFSLQATQKSFIEMLTSGIYTCGVPYVLIITFYVIAIQTKQYKKIIFLLLFDVFCSTIVILNFGYFNEYIYALRNSIIAFLLICVVKSLILIRWRVIKMNKSKFIT